jgi:hypothetical protein
MSSLCAPAAPHALALSLLYVCATPAIREVINKTIERPTRSIRSKHWMNENNTTGNDDYIPSLYIPTKWKPPEAPEDVEYAIKNFSSQISDNINRKSSNTRTNLTKLQYSCLHLIKNDHRLIVCTSDKNLGPVT